MQVQLSCFSLVFKGTVNTGKNAPAEPEIKTNNERSLKNVLGIVKDRAIDG